MIAGIRVFVLKKPSIRRERAARRNPKVVSLTALLILSFLIILIALKKIYEASRRKASRITRPPSTRS